MTTRHIAGPAAPGGTGKSTRALLFAAELAKTTPGVALVAAEHSGR